MARGDLINVVTQAEAISAGSNLQSFKGVTIAVLAADLRGLKITAGPSVRALSAGHLYWEVSIDICADGSSC
ncbi:MAG: hypothetical protein M0008_07445 [Actinomycetota bacterium]|nr:hypothetical protein [Actinomycetota bacterium]